ncbi:hypothetical protein SDC9_111769 [bioreactor metagenome]|uniref:Uncharacterized protein n=1 Tax=bioreactor metagenome TaxID=1076179 RepID=A0A645BIH0_9ZZZZ
MDLDGLILADPQLHPPRERGLRAESLPVHEIAPATDALADKKAHDAKVEHCREFELFYLAVNKRNQNPHDHRAVHGDSAVPYGQHPTPVQTAVRVAVQVQIEDHIINTGADDAQRRGPEDHIDHVVLRQTKPLGLLHAEIQSGQQTQSQNNTVPVNAMPDVDGNGVRVNLEPAEQPRKPDGHIAECFQISQIRNFLSPSLI